MSKQPAVLLVTSVGAPDGGVTPVLAALEASALRVRAIDVGRAGTRSDGTLEKVLQALAGEVAERRLLREIQAHPPDVMVAFDPATTTALSVVRDESMHAAPVIAIVADLHPDPTWAATDADRYLAIDDEAAVNLADHGVEAERIIPVGPLCEWAFTDVARTEQSKIREQYRLAKGAPIVVVDVAGFGYEGASQIAMQLSLIPGNATYLFDAGRDSEAATALRRQVPTLDIRGKLFGKTQDAPRFWRAADVIVARPTNTAVARAMVLGTRMVSFVPEGREGTQLAKAMEQRQLGTTASTILLLSSALEPLLRQGDGVQRRAGVDGPSNVADIAWVVASEHRAVIDERRAAARADTRARVEAAASAAEAAARATATAGGLEDLSDAGPSAAAPPDPGELSQLRSEVQARIQQASAIVGEARAAVERWDKRCEQARRRGDQSTARDAERQADAERARMHAALAEMAQLQGELERLERAAAAAPPPRHSASPSGGTGRSAGTGGGATQPNVDELLDQMKRQHGGGADKQHGGESRAGAAADPYARLAVDDELNALKRKMKTKKNR